MEICWGLVPPAIVLVVFLTYWIFKPDCGDDYCTDRENKPR